MRSSKVGAWVLGTAIIAAALTGCAGSGKEGEAKTAPVAINTLCPIGGHDVDAEIVREWKGQKIAFCCDGCTAKWDAMAEAKRDEVLAAARANKAI